MEPSSAWATVITITELCHTATHAIREYAVKMKASAHHGPDQRYGEMVVQVDGLKKVTVQDSVILLVFKLTPLRPLLISTPSSMMKMQEGVPARVRQLAP